MNNRYHRKRQHKRAMKKRYAKTWYWGNGSGSWNGLVAQYENGHPWMGEHALDYWRNFYLTGPRQYAKDATNDKVRAESRFIEHLAKSLIDVEDLEIGRNTGAHYRKEFDYDWTVW